MSKQGVLALIAAIGMTALVVLFVWTIYVMSPKELGSALGSRSDHVVEADLEWGCELSDPRCLHETQRRALGGDPASQFELVRYFSSQNPSGYANSEPLVEEFVWSALGACSGRDSVVDPELKTVVFCPVRYESESSLYNEDYKPTWIQKQVCPRGGLDNVGPSGCMGPDTWDTCLRVIGKNQSVILDNLNVVIANLSTEELDRGRAMLRERLSRTGPSGLVQVGDLHQRGCGLDRSNVKAGAAYLAASNLGSNYGEELWGRLQSSMTDREKEKARQLSKSVTYESIIRQERTKVLSLLEAERIRVSAVRHALFSLGHFPPKCDPNAKNCDKFGRVIVKKDTKASRQPATASKEHQQKTGSSSTTLAYDIKDRNSAFLGSNNELDPDTLKSIKSFQKCEKLAPTGKLTALTTCKILEVAALGGRSEPDGEVNHCHPNIRTSTGGALNLWGLTYAYGVCHPKDQKKALQFVNEAQNVLGGFPPAYVSAEKIYSEKLAPCANTEEERNQYLQEAKRYRQLAYDKLGERYKDEVGKLWKGFLTKDVGAAECD